MTALELTHELWTDHQHACRMVKQISRRLETIKTGCCACWLAESRPRGRSFERPGATTCSGLCFGEATQSACCGHGVMRSCCHHVARTIRRRIGNSTSSDHPGADDTGLRRCCCRPSRRGQSVYCLAHDGCARGDNAHQKQQSPDAATALRRRSGTRGTPLSSSCGTAPGVHSNWEIVPAVGLTRRRPLATACETPARTCCPDP